MNKIKKTTIFNISVTFGVLALLFACIYLSFFVNPHYVLAYVDNSVECSIVSTDKNYKGSLYNSSISYAISYPNGINTPFVCYKLNFVFNESIEFDSFLLSLTNFEGLFDYPLSYSQLTDFGFLVSISSEINDESWGDYNFGDMLALVRPDNEFSSYFSVWDQDDNNFYGRGTYLINFNSSQEILNEGMLTIYILMGFDMNSTQWTAFKSYNTYARYKNCFGIQILEPGVINPDGSYTQGYEVGYNKGVNLSNQARYDEGYTAGVEAGGNIGSWLAGIGEAPLTLIKSLFNIEIFGINLNTIVFSLLGALVVIKLIRLFI